MKKLTHYFVWMLCILVFSCQSDQEPVVVKETGGVPDAILTKLKAAGFDTSEGTSRYKEGYLVEYDIFLTEEQISELPDFTSIAYKNGRVKHFRTNNLVQGTPRTITVYMDNGFGSYLQSSFDLALSRYNSQNLGLTFQRASSSAGADISILSFYEQSNVLGYSAGFPSGGNPASPIQLNTYYYNNSSQRADAATVIAHEIGHAIGFRHTDFMNRAFSCGSGGNEGDAGVGAVQIPGTPSGPSAGSWMLACSNNTDRPFTAADITALTNVYPRINPNNKNILNPGEQLTQGQSLLSTDGRFTLVLQGDGNLVLYQGSLALWASNTAGRPYITTCAMQGDGNLVLYGSNGVAYWASGTAGYPGAFLALQNDGNLVIYQNNVARWSTNTCCR